MADGGLIRGRLQSAPGGRHLGAARRSGAHRGRTGAQPAGMAGLGSPPICDWMLGQLGQANSAAPAPAGASAGAATGSAQDRARAAEPPPPSLPPNGPRCTSTAPCSSMRRAGRTWSPPAWWPPSRPGCSQRRCGWSSRSAAHGRRLGYGRLSASCARTDPAGTPRNRSQYRVPAGWSSTFPVLAGEDDGAYRVGARRHGPAGFGPAAQGERSVVVDTAGSAMRRRRRDILGTGTLCPETLACREAEWTKSGIHPDYRPVVFRYRFGEFRVPHTGRADVRREPPGAQPTSPSRHIASPSGPGWASWLTGAQ